MIRKGNERAALFFLGILTGFVVGFTALVGLDLIPVHKPIEAAATFSHPVVTSKDAVAEPTPWFPDYSGLASAQGLIWPVKGPIASYYGPTHPLGIDIDGYDLAGAPVVAATDGTILFSGGNACCSYGLFVVLVKDNWTALPRNDELFGPANIETLYAHLSQLLVSQGEEVKQGQVIGIIGSTGYSTGRHLHFEVIDSGVRENPLDYLPKMEGRQ